MNLSEQLSADKNIWNIIDKYDYFKKFSLKALYTYLLLTVCPIILYFIQYEPFSYFGYSDYRFTYLFISAFFAFFLIKQGFCLVMFKKYKLKLLENLTHTLWHPEHSSSFYQKFISLIPHKQNYNQRYILDGIKTLFFVRDINNVSTLYLNMALKILLEDAIENSHAKTNVQDLNFFEQNKNTLYK